MNDIIIHYHSWYLTMIDDNSWSLACPDSDLAALGADLLDFTMIGELIWYALGELDIGKKHHGESWESSSWCSWKYQRDHQNCNWNNHWYSGTIYVVDETFKGKLDNRQMVSTHPINMGLYLTINDRLVSNSKWLKTIQVKISRIIDICHDIPWYT